MTRPDAEAGETPAVVGGVEALDARPVKLKRSELQGKIREMASFLSGIGDDLKLPGVKPDSVAFTFTVGSDGVVRWLLGAKIEGSACITFKFVSAAEAS